jgi:hypothetical protein
MNIFEKLMAVTIGILILFFILDKMDDRIQAKLEQKKRLTGFETFLLNYVNKIVNLIVRAYPLVFIGIIVTLYVEYSPAVKKAIENTVETLKSDSTESVSASPAPVVVPAPAPAPVPAFNAPIMSI